MSTVDSPWPHSKTGKIMTGLVRRLTTRWNGPRSRHLVRNHLRHWCLDHELPTLTEPGFRMLANPRNYASYGIYFFGEYDRRMTDIVKQYVRIGDTAWDIGTDRGWFTLLLAKQVGPTGCIDAFEAFPENAEKLQSNVNLNEFRQVRVHPMAVSDCTGPCTFEPPGPEAGGDDCPTVHSGVGHLSNSPGPNALEVNSITLDQFAAEHEIERLDFVKLDIEGAEVQALHGGLDVLTKHKPMIAVEYNRMALRRSGTSLAELDGLLDGMGYERLARRASGFRPVDLEECRDKPDRHAVFNVYCFHRQGRHEPK